MEQPAQKRSIAWQPLTPRGVAAFARASFGSLLLVQCVFALIGAGAVVWFLHYGWFPVIGAAVRILPEQGEIRKGKLDWRGESPVRLAENRFLALAVDLRHEGKTRSSAHLQVEFGLTNCKVFSVLGYIPWRYPSQYIIAFNQRGLEPWWGAWSPVLLAIAAAAVMIGLLLSWPVFATLYALPVWLFAFFGNRDLDLGRSWRLSGAAQMPGALFLTATILVYGLGALDLVQLGVGFGLHFLVAWFYLVAGIIAAPKPPDAPRNKENPFAPPGSEEGAKS